MLRTITPSRLIGYRFFFVPVQKDTAVYCFVKGICEIVQLADWGETVPVDQVRPVLDHGTRRPATGVIVFAWGGLRQQRDKVDAMVNVFRAMKP